MENLEQDVKDQASNAGSSIQFFDEAYQDMPKNAATVSDSSHSGSGKFSNFFKNHKKWIAIILAFFVLFGGAYFGLSFYEHYLRVLPIENILPANANIVAKITINPDGQQFKLLESNLEKFPGYHLLKKKLDDAGEGKTVSQLIQDKFKERGLDFQTDIKPVISDQAYVVIPDAGPLGKNLQNETLLSLENGKSKYLAAAPDSENKGEVVLGDSSTKTTLIPVDFIVASEIINKSKAKDVLAKLQKDDHYKVTAKSDSGYTYYEVRAQGDGSSNNSSYVNYAVTYHALLGSNWVFTSKEDYMKQMIAIAKKQQLVPSLFAKKSLVSLKDDADFQKVNSDLDSKNSDNLVQVYYKLNFSDFFGKRDCGGGDCPSISDYIKYPENIISGFLVHVETDGIAITMDSNGTSLGDLQNVPAEKSLAQIIPNQVDQRWTDAFFEYSNFKELYYSFKKNNLTDKGLTEWNNAVAQIKTMTGIDPEVNFIDLIKGSGTFVLFTKKDNSPEGAAIFEITDPERMNDTMHKLVETIKNSQIESYSSYIEMSGGGNTFKGSTDPKFAKFAKQMQDTKKKYQAALDKVKNSAIKETVLPEGKIYSYAIESPEASPLLPSYSVTLNYSLEDGRFIFSTDYSAVQSLLAGLKNGSQTSSLAKSENYKTASRYFAPQMYTDSYVYTEGICNSLDYFFHKFTDSLSSIQDSMCAQAGAVACQKQKEEMATMKQKQDDGLFAIESVIRTLKLTGGYSAMADKTVKSSWFLNIVEIPKEEKDRAERILEQL